MLLCHKIELGRKSGGCAGIAAAAYCYLCSCLREVVAKSLLDLFLAPEKFGQQNEVVCDVEKVDALEGDLGANNASALSHFNLDISFVAVEILDPKPLYPFLRFARRS